MTKTKQLVIIFTNNALQFVFDDRKSPGGQYAVANWDNPVLDDSIPDHAPLVCDRLYASHAFFDKITAYHFKHQDVVSQEEAKVFKLQVNIILAVLNQYGCNVRYTEAFVKSMNDMIIDIIQYAYVNEDDTSPHALRHFNGSQLTHSEFTNCIAEILYNHTSEMRMNKSV